MGIGVVLCRKELCSMNSNHAEPRQITEEEEFRLVAEFQTLLERWRDEGICPNDIACVLEDEITKALHPL